MEAPNHLEELERKTGLYLAELIRAGLNDVAAPEKPAEIEWKDICRLADKNGVLSTAFFGLRHLQQKPEEDIYNKWKARVDHVLYRSLRFAEEREGILADMEHAGLSYLPLKGILIEQYYPHPGMRTMSDNDILYGFVEKNEQQEFQIIGFGTEEKNRQIKKALKLMTSIMKNRGFEVKQIKANEHIYCKEPIYNFEMHCDLFPRFCRQRAYYSNPWKKAVQDPNHPCRFSLSDEDEYIYYVAHAFKHYAGSGSGFRFLVDLQVFYQKKRELLDFAYIREELRKLEMEDFEKEMRELSNHAFRGGTLSKEEQDTLLDMQTSGTHGTEKKKITKNVQACIDAENGNVRRGKWNYIKKRLFPSGKYCGESYHPFFEKHRGFIWLLLIYRVLRGVIVHPHKLWEEIKLLKSKPDKEG